MPETNDCQPLRALDWEAVAEVLAHYATLLAKRKPGDGVYMDGDYAAGTVLHCLAESVRAGLR